MNKQFVIIGAGISGLSDAFHIFQKYPHSSISLIESSDKIGGKIITNRLDRYYCEDGPRSLRVSSYSQPIYKIIQEVGLINDIEPSVSQDFRYIYWEGKMLALPGKFRPNILYQSFKNIKGDLSSLFRLFQSSKRAKNLAQDVSISEYFQDQDQKIVQKYLETIYYGIYGTSISNLSTQLCFNKIHLKGYQSMINDGPQDLKLSSEFNSFYKSKLKNESSYRFKYGLQQLPQSIDKYLKERSDQYNLITGEEVEFIDVNNKIVKLKNQELVYDNLLLNIPLSPLKQLFQSSFNDSEINNKLSTVKQASIYSKTLCFDKQVLPLSFKGFGYLVNPSQNQKIIGAIMDHLSFPHLYPKDSNVISVLMLEDHSISDILKDLSTHLNVQIPEPVHISEYFWKDAFVIYEPSHFEKMKEIQDRLDDLSQKSITIGGQVLHTGAIPELVYESYTRIKVL